MGATSQTTHNGYGVMATRINFQEAFPIPILEKKLGNKGTKITPFGEELLKRYLDLCNHLSKESENFINWTASKQINK